MENEKIWYTYFVQNDKFTFCVKNAFFPVGGNNFLRRGKTMKIGAKRFLSLMLCCIIALGLLPATAFAEDQEVTITKVWEDKGHEKERPEKVTINLLDANNKVIKHVTLPDSNENWTTSLTVKGDVVSIQEELGGEYANKYNVSYTEPRKEQISLDDWYEKVPPANQTSFTLQSVNIVVAKKGGNYYIWTETALTEDQILSVIAEINDKVSGKELSSGNTEFRSGLSATFGVELSISKNGQNNNVEIIFGEKSAWSLFYYGTLTITPATGWIVKNTYNPKINIAVTKKWEHNGNNNAPSSVQVQLYADGDPVNGALLTLQSNDADSNKNWKGTFENLPKYYNDNTEIQYTVQEVNVPEGYESKVEEKDEGVFVITNTYTPTSAPESKPESKPESAPESKPIRDTVTIEIGNNEKTEEANPDTGAPLMFAPVMVAALAAAVVVKRKK